jgi:FKBP-type peptidyl-prolyl cis-trans isomerase SlyD
MYISKEKVVTLSYELTSDTGELLDRADSSNPFQFIHGIGMTIPGFDKGLLNLQEGDNFDFTVSPEEGYGDVYEENIVEIAASTFVGAPEGMLQIGNFIPMQDGEGNRMQGKVLEITPEVVVLDFNHPLAGTTLRFKGKILAIREAQQDELAHGHVHGHGGIIH